MNIAPFAIAALIVAAQAGALAWLGQPLTCKCGFALWEGDMRSSGLSQQLADWYSLTHIGHGLMFYFLLRLVARRLSVPKRFLIALAMEATWEVAENLPAVIQLYRQQALAQGYVGDSIVNSLSDTAMMSTGFLFAARLPPRAALALFVAIEAGLAFTVRDNLTLNMLNFIHRFEAVDRWQREA